jgi:autotransporter-associated beta strand protein
MHSKISTIQTLFGVKSWRSRLWLLIAFAALCGGVARAQQTDTWTGTAGTGSWTNGGDWNVGGNLTVGMITNGGDNLVFPFLGANYYYGSTNDYAAGLVTIGSMTFGTNSYKIGGNSLTIGNGIADAWGSNTISTPLVLGASQTFQNTAVGGVGNPLGGITNNLQTTIAGTINTGTNTLTTSGSGTIYLNGIITGATNGGGVLVVAGGVTRLGPSSGSTGNGFGTNWVSETPNFIPYGTNIVQLTTNIVSGATNLTLKGIDYVTNAVAGGWVTNYIYSTNIVVAATNIVTPSTNVANYLYGTNATSWTNYTYLITNGFSTNITWTYVTNLSITTSSNIAWATNSVVLVQDVVTVRGGAVMQAGTTAASTVPNGAGVGNLWLDGTWDLNQSSPTINGLEDSGSGTGIIDNSTNTGTYTLTIGNASSNGVYSGVIQNTAGTVAVTKTGFGTQTFTGGNQYSGATTINQGTLVLGISPNNTEGSLGANSTQLTIASGAVFDFSALNAYNDFTTATGPLTVSAGTPTKPYTNFWGSYYPFYPATTNYVVTVTTNNYVYSNTVVAYNGSSWTTNAYYTTNFLNYSYSTNSIASIINYDVIGNFLVNGGGAISPVTTVAPGIATWSINGNLTLDASGRSGANRINYLLNNSTAVGGGTNDLIAVSGKLTIGDEVDFVISTVTGSLASGKYTLMTSSQYISTSPNDAAAAKLVLIAPRGITGAFDYTSQPGNILLQASGTVAPGTITWAGTPSANTWDVALTKNWKNGVASDYFYSQDNVTFDDTGVAAVNLPVVLTPSSMTFNNNLSNYVFTASPETSIAGTGGITLNGTGSVTLNNPNSFIGDTVINQGTLIVGSYGGYGNVLLYNTVPPARLVFGGLGQSQFQANEGLANTSQSVTFSDLVLNSGANAQLNSNGRGANDVGYMAFNGNIIRNVGSSIYMNYTVKGSSANNGIYFTNTLPWSNGLLLGGYAHVGTDWFAAQTNFNNGNGLASQTYGGYTNITSASAIALLQGTNNISLTGATALALTASAAVNTLKITGPAGITISSGMTLTDATGGLLVSSASTAASTILGGTLMGAPGADLIVLQNNTTYALTIGSVIADNGSATALTLGGLGGTVILTNNNTYTGVTYLNSGTLQVGNGAALGSIATSSAILDNGVLSFNRPDATSVGAISGTGSLTQSGTGTLTLTANNALSGLVTVSSGTLQLGTGAAVGSVSNAVGIVNNGSVVFDNNNTVGYPKAISGLGSVVQAGTGTLVIATNETYSGNTIISNGVVKLMPTGSISNTAAIILAGGVLNIDPGTLTLRSALPSEILTGSGTIMGSVAAPSGAKIIPGTNGVVGTLNITNTLTLNGGVYQFDIGTNASDRINCGNLVQTAGTLVYNVTAGPLTNGIYTLIYSTNAMTGSYANIALAGFVPSGQLAVLTNSTAHTLDMLVYSGYAPVIYWKGDGSQNYWNATANSYWVDGGNNSITYASADIVNFTDTGSDNVPVTLNASSVYPGVVTVNSTQNYTIGDGSTANAANVISGGASLVKSGTGTLTLQSVNSYLGTTTINQGVVQLNGAGTASSADGMLGTGTVTDNGTLIANNVASETLFGGLVGTGSLVQQGSGALILAGENSGFSGPVSVTNVLQVGNGVSGDLGTGNVTNNGALVFNNPSTITVSGNISGSGVATNLGTGIVVMTGSNTYSGNTAIQAGTVRMGSTNAIPIGTALYMDDNVSPNPVGHLDLNGHDLNVISLQGTNYGIGTASFEAAQIYNNGTGTNTLVIGGGGTYTFSGMLLDNNNSGTGRLALMVTNDTTLNLFSGYNASSGTAFANGFSGGLIISNATVRFGNGGQAIDRLNGQDAAGLGMITLCGGLGTITNGNTGIPTNSIFLPAQTGSPNSGRSEYNTYPTINIPAGQSGSIFLDGYGGLSFPLIGSGTLTIQPDYVRDQVSGNWTNFTGTIIFQAISFASYGVSGDGGFTITSAGNAGFPQATLYMHTNNIAFVNVSGGTAGNVLPVGALMGGDNTSAFGGGTQGNGSSGGAAATIWAFGSLNTSTTNGSQFIDNGCGIRKVGTGTLTLTNMQMTFLGQCVVSNGTLAFAPLAPSPSLGYVSNYLVASNFTIVAPGVLDIRSAGCSLNLGGHTNQGGAFITQSLFGDGTLNGDLVATNSMIAPAWGVNSRPPSLGTLTINGSATINGLSTIEMYINPTNSPTYDSLVATNGLTINSARLTVATNTFTAFAGGTSNVFRFFPTAVPLVIGNSGGITNITLPKLPNSYWVTNLALDGSMALVVSNTASTNALLSGLTITPAGTLSPAFGSNTLTYAAAEAYVNGTITVTPTDWSTNATNYVVYLGSTNVVVSGVASPSLTLNANPSVANVVRVHVTAQDNVSVADYTINVTRNPDRTPAAIVNSFDGSYLTMSWPLSENGYQLQAQTNQLGTGLSTNWVVVAGSTSTNVIVIPITATNGSVFYRLVNTNNP